MFSAAKIKGTVKYDDGRSETFPCYRWSEITFDGEDALIAGRRHKKQDSDNWVYEDAGGFGLDANENLLICGSDDEPKESYTPDCFSVGKAEDVKFTDIGLDNVYYLDKRIVIDYETEGELEWDEEVDDL